MLWPAFFSQSLYIARIQRQSLPSPEKFFVTFSLLENPELAAIVLIQKETS